MLDAGAFGAALIPARLLPPPHIQNHGKRLGRWCVTVLWFDWFAAVGSQTVSLGGSPGLAGVLQLVGFAKVGFFAVSQPKLLMAGRKSVRATFVLRFMRIGALNWAHRGEKCCQVGALGALR